MNQISKRFAMGGVVLAALLYATAAPIIRWAGQDAGMLAVAFYRMLIASCVWVPVFLVSIRKYPRSMHPTPRQKKLIAVAGIFLGLHFALWTSAFAHTTVASATFLILTQPIMAAVAAHFYLKETLNRWNLLAMGLMLAGAFAIFGGDFMLGPGYLFGDMLALLGAAGSAGYLFMARIARPDRPGSGAGVPLGLYLPPVYGIATLLLGLICLVSGETMAGFSGSTWISFALLGLLPTVVGHSLFNWASRYLPAFSVNITVVGEPVGASLLVFFLFGEVPSRALLIGAPLMILAVLLVFLKPPQEGQVKPIDLQQAG